MAFLAALSGVEETFFIDLDAIQTGMTASAWSHQFDASVEKEEFSHLIFLILQKLHACDLFGGGGIVVMKKDGLLEDLLVVMEYGICTRQSRLAKIGQDF